METRMRLKDAGTEYEVGPEELDRLRKEDPDLVVLDCREAVELARAALPGVLHIPMRQIPGRLDELDPEKDLVVLCHHGIRSLQVTRWLREAAGLSQVKSLRGGIDAWSRMVDPTVPRY